MWKYTDFKRQVDDLNCSGFFFSLPHLLLQNPKEETDSANSVKLDSYEFPLPPHSHLFSPRIIPLFMEWIREVGKDFK